MTADTPSPSEVELLPCGHCGTAMVNHGHCFSHPRPASGDCILRHYSFDINKADKWNTRTSSARSSTVDEATVGWQPIETAPKDGRTILLLEPHFAASIVTPGRWFEDEQGWWEHGSHPTDYADQPVENPTHWMSLPEPPASLPSVAVQPIGEQ